MAERGLFITVEGGEGVGKSLLIANLSRVLRQRGVELVTTREPGGTPSADRIRGLFADGAPGDDWLMTTEALLVSAARAQHCGRLIEPALARGHWVLCDRFADSTRVYQGALGGLAREALEQLIAFSTGGLTPDVTLLLDCEVGLTLERLGRSRRPEAIARYDDDGAAFHEKRRQAFLELARQEPQRFVVLDAAAAPEIVKDAALAALDRWIAP